MDKTITLVVAATVLLMAGGALMFMTNAGIAGFNNDAEQSQTGAKCSFQVDQYCSGAISISEVDAACMDEVNNQCP